MENLILSINCVFPIFISMLAGYFAQARHIIPEETFSHLSTLCFQLLLPVMLFGNLYSADFSQSFSVDLVVFLISATLICFFAAYLSGLWLIPDHRFRGTWVQGIYRSNIAVIGIALAQVLIDAAGVATITVVIAIIVPIYNALAVITLETCRGSKVPIGTTLKKILTNPMIVGSVLGLVFHFAHIPLPSSVLTPIDNIGKAGSVMMLIALGASFRLRNVGKNRLRLVVISTLRLILVPAAALVIAYLLGFRKDELAIVLICMGSPVAASVFPMAQTYDSDYELAGQLVVVTSLLCCLTFFLSIFGLKQVGIL